MKLDRPCELDYLVWQFKIHGMKLKDICETLGVNESFVLYSYQLKRRIDYVKKLENALKHGNTK